MARLVGTGPRKHDVPARPARGECLPAIAKHGRGPRGRERQSRLVVQAVAAVETGHRPRVLDGEPFEIQRHVVEPRLARAPPEENEVLDLRDRFGGVEGVVDELPVVSPGLEALALPPEVGAVVIPTVHEKAVVVSPRVLGLAPSRDPEGMPDRRIEGDFLHGAPDLVPPRGLTLDANSAVLRAFAHERVALAIGPPGAGQCLGGGLEVGVRDEIGAALRCGCSE